MQKTDTTSNYWLHVAARKINEVYPEGSLTISSGISPSANYHIGHFPEIFTAEALKWVLQDQGRDVRHVHVVDNMDPLRKRYDFLPKEYEQYVGWPICLVPSPYGEGSYADHFFAEFRGHFETMGIAPDEIVFSYEDLYRSGRMAHRIEQVLENIETVRQIFARFGREVARDWTPLQVMNEDGVFINARIATWDKERQTIEDTDYTAGKAKLNWRLDWPARWAELEVDVEPFNNHEHGASGGSYDTGAVFAREVFDRQPPIPGARYGNIHLNDDPKKMSSSKGNLITPSEVLKLIPPSVLRYFVIRSRVGKNLHFYTDTKFPQLIDEYKNVAHAVTAGEDHEFTDAYRFADIGDQLTNVPFMHLVNVYQAARRDIQMTHEILNRTGYETDKDVLTQEIHHVAHWLDVYAPDNVTFQLHEGLPDVALEPRQKEFLSGLADRIAAQDELEAEWVHATIYELKDIHEISAGAAFQSIYLALLGQKSGPKAGWYLATIDRNWLIKRLKWKA